jgi:hypothetical protein
VRVQYDALEHRVLGDDPGPVKRRVFNRFVSGAVIGILALLILTPIFGFVTSAVWAWLVFMALYVPPWEEIPRVGRLIRPLAVLALVILYPYYFDHMFQIPIFGAFPDVATGVYMLVFIMMAIGLNMVVGYAGLLDLGYVAFYAIGAYTAARSGWGRVSPASTSRSGSCSPWQRSWPRSSG